MIRLYNDDCFNVFPELPEGSIDLVLCDMPYGTTACKWDTVIDLERMWRELKRIVKPNAAIVLTACQPFTSVLICSNLHIFKQQLVWVKSLKTNFLNAKKQHLKRHEDVLVFYYKQCTYNPQGLVEGSISGGNKRAKNREDFVYGKFGDNYQQLVTGYPDSIISIPNPNQGNVHPTQKPVALMEYLIKTYSNEGNTVLDFCMGSGTTGVAAKNLNRSFIGIELLKEYYDIADRRIINEETDCVKSSNT